MPHFRIRARRVLGLISSSSAAPFFPSDWPTGFLEHLEDVVVFQLVESFDVLSCLLLRLVECIEVAQNL